MRKRWESDYCSARFCRLESYKEDIAACVSRCVKWNIKYCQILLFKVFFLRNLMRCLLVLVTSPTLVLRIPQFLLARFPWGKKTWTRRVGRRITVYVEPEFHVCCFNPQLFHGNSQQKRVNPQLLNVNSCNFLRFYAFFSQHFLVARIKLYRL